MKNQKLVFGSILLLCLLASIFIVQLKGVQSLSFNSSTLTKPIEAAYTTTDGTLYASSLGSIYRSYDKGQTWSSALITIPNADDISCLFVASNGYIYFSPSGNSLSQSNTGLWRSTNQGQTWTRVLTLSVSESVWGIDEDSTGNLFAGIYTTGDLNSNARIYKSTNNAASWISVFYDQAARHIHSVRVDKSNNFIYASIGDDFSIWNVAYVIRSTNGGSTWTKILEGMPQVVAIEILPGARIFGTDFYAANGLFRTTDDNSYTQVLDVGASSYCFWIRKSDVENYVFAGFCSGEGSPRSAGVYVSTNDGLTWTLAESLSAQNSYDGTTVASNYVQGMLYHNVVVNGDFQYGKCISSGIALPTPTPAATQAPTQELFNADFEVGSFSEYQGTNGAGTYTATVELGNPHHGSYDAKFTSSASSESWAYKSISSSSIAYYRQLIKISTLPAQGTYLYLGSLQNSNSENTLDPFIYNSNGQYYWGTVSVINGAFYWDRETMPSNPKTGVYYNVEICRDTAGHRSQLWVDGTSKVNADRPHVGNTNFLCTGISYSESSSTVFIDCIKVSTTYIGPESSPQPTPTPSATPTPTPTPTPKPYDAPLTNAIQVNANVTVTAVNFQQSTTQLNITIIKNGTNQIDTTINKNSLPTISTLKVFINGSQKSYSYIDNDDSWKVTIKTT
jgi:photosystem II stability/assembly factor-like uncharacterized protein